MKADFATPTPHEENSNAAKPFVSIVVPAFNEEELLEKNLARLCDYMKSVEREYRWEIVVVNDGSGDATGEIAERFAATNAGVRVVHHEVNMNLGQALRTGFLHSRGEYLVTMDLDLSYSPDHIARLLARITRTRAQIVLASPYMKGGRYSNVPGLRLVLSIYGNRYLSFMSQTRLATLTGMVRAYEGKFARSLILKARGMEVNAEIIMKAQMLNARVEEIPAHLCWNAPNEAPRKSHMKILRNVWQTLVLGFMMRPAVLFFAPALFLLALTCGLAGWSWSETHSFSRALELWNDRASTVALAMFLLFGIGVVTLQIKRYFEELFYNANYRRSAHTATRLRALGGEGFSGLGLEGTLEEMMGHATTLTGKERFA